jgi:anthranilate synthase component 1
MPMLISIDPRKTLQIGPGYDYDGDPLQAELSTDRVLHTHVFSLQNLTGGAVGYLSYDCIRYFEPRTERPLKDQSSDPRGTLHAA